ncbi:MAG: DUF3597 family protein, partial [Agathobacter sp.]|nr:DUF3597 family protein [Agathobacter sp.]
EQGAPQYASISAADELSIAFDKYYSSTNRPSANQQNPKDVIENMYAIIEPTIEAYEALIDADYKLSNEEQTHYDKLRSLQDRYLQYRYDLNGLKETYQALSIEQQKNILLNKLTAQGLSDIQANAVLDSVSESDYTSLWEKGFSFTPPQMTDYDTAEEYGKAYANAWLNGVKNGVDDPNKTDISFTDQLSKIQSLSKGLEQLDKIYVDVWDGQTEDGQTFDWSSILNNDEFEKTFGDFKEEYNELIKTIANSPNDVDACQESFNKLATAYVYGREELKNVTEETKSATVAMLQQVGVSNALEVVEAQLAINTANAADAQATLNQMKAQGIDTSVDLENATAVELLTLCQEGEQAGINTSALYNYVMQKIQANKITISTSGDVKALMNLCKGLGVASKALGKYESIKARFDSLKGKTDSESIRTRQALGYQMSQLVQEMNDSVSDLANLSVQTPVNFTGGEATKKVQEQASKDAEKSAETFDWIERAITNVQKKVERLGKVVSSTFKTWSTRNNALVQEMNAVAESINVQANAYNAYMAQANSVGLSDYYKGLVQSGAYNIEEVADDTLKEQIQKYQEFYDKAIECSDAIDDLRANMAELAKQKFDNISSEFDARLNAIEHRTNMLNKSMELNETKGYITATTYYEELVKIEQNNINEFIKEREALTKAMNEAISNGTIQVYSEDWYEMQKSIMDVDESIQDATNSIAEFQDKIRETKWELFDRIQDTISQLQSESDFIIDLMSNGKLFEDNGNWTNQATATGGLHAVNYNVYMAQSDEYAKEIENINKELANDPYNTKLLDRRKELLEAQIENIKAAEQEKQSIKDLYSQGYDNMLSYLQKLIDKRKELLNAEKDLFSYEKQISEQTKNIGSLEKQLGAMYGDNSEETQAKIQQIKVQLEEARSTLQETEYDKWLSDQQMILDNIYSEAEQWVNERLDNIDSLLQEMIDTTNAKAVEIDETIVTETEKVGYKLSEDMSRLFTISDGNITNVVTRYGDNFINSFTTVNSTLLDIKKSVDKMVKKAEEQAKAEAERLAKEEAQRQAQAQQQAAQQAYTPTPAPAPTPSSTPAQTTPSWGSWFITGSQYYDRNAKNTETSIVDRLKSRSINSAFSARAGYYTAMGGSGTYTGSASQNTWMIQQMKAHGYYKGSKRIKEDELAWTQEKGQELIYRSSDGAMLTPLGQGDSVFTNDMTNTLWSFAKNPDMFANLVTSTALPRVSGSQLGTVNNDVVLNIALPNVQNTTDFINELKTNKQFEKVIQAMTIGNAMGNNSLNKMRIR